MNRSVLAGLVIVLLVLPAAVSGSNAQVSGSGSPTTSPSGTDAGTSATVPALSSADPGSGGEYPAIESPLTYSTTLEPGVADDSTTSYALQEAESIDEFNNTRFEITVSENGTAEWTFQKERHLEDDEIDDFETFAEEFETEETDLYEGFQTQATALAETGAENTGREMEATDFNRSAGVEHGLNERGVVEMSFTWTNFAETDGDAVVVGDVFDEMYLTSDQSLVIRPGDDLVFVEAYPESYDDVASLEGANSLTWKGEREFVDGQPTVELTPNGGSPAEGDQASTTTDPVEGDLGWLLLAAVVGLGVGGGALWYRRRSGHDGEDDFRDAPTPPADVAVDDGNGGAAPEAAGRTESAGSPLPEEELLTDEDRVVTLIRENGGRMKQVNIVDETGWSKSKVSMLLSEMEDEGTISKLRVGRENIISLEGFEPEATKSPFDE
ncbi:hypothetical protein ACFQGT_14600 [Natrialbaceae archaeon GCM10025810]|uniref:DUF7343 domain-containing protein n=1 Tax=Halovalidus salilacus TaxID=3075124 RepID=UPI003617C494